MFKMPSIVSRCSKFLFRPHDSQMHKKVQPQCEPQRPGPHDYPTFPPPPPQEILAHRSEYEYRMHARKTLVPKGAKADTPLYTLYRLYEYFVIDSVTDYRNTLEYFWNHHGWAVSSIPDPQDDDPSRYAFLACTTASMVESFNAKIKMGQARDAPAIMSPEEAEYYRTRPESTKIYEEVPEWAKRVPPLRDPLIMRSFDDIILDGFDDPRACEQFKPMNILMWGPHIHFT